MASRRHLTRITMTLLRGIVISLFALGLTTGCDRDDQAATGGGAADELKVAAEETKSETATGKVVASHDLPKRPRRIVSLAPNVTEILFAIGAGDRVVGVTRFCDHPPEAAELPRIGGYTDPDFEAIIGLKPDVVIGVTAGGDSSLPRKLAEAGLPYLFVQMDTLEQTYSGIELIGNASGHLKGALLTSQKIQTEIHETASAADLETAPRVLFVLGHDPLVVAGPGSFPHELLRLAGGTNAVGDVNKAYPVLDIEKVLQLDPDVIIDAYMTGEGDPEPFWKNYPALKAVSERRIHRFTDSALLRPGPRLDEGFQRIADAIRGTN